MDALQAASAALKARSVVLCAASARLHEAGKQLRQQSDFALRGFGARFSRSADLLTVSRFQRHRPSVPCLVLAPRPPVLRLIA
jgi:hypothetical protein